MWLQSVYPAGPLSLYFWPLTRADENPGRLLAFPSQACWHIASAHGHPQIHKRTLGLYTNSTYAGTLLQLPVHACKYWTHRWESTPNYTYVHSFHLSRCRATVLTPTHWPYSQRHTALHYGLKRQSSGAKLWLTNTSFYLLSIHFNACVVKARTSYKSSQNHLQLYNCKCFSHLGDISVLAEGKYIFEVRMC